MIVVRAVEGRHPACQHTRARKETKIKIFHLFVHTPVPVAEFFSKSNGRYCMKKVQTLDQKDIFYSIEKLTIRRRSEKHNTNIWKHLH
jgi:hypothetical protein